MNRFSAYIVVISLLSVGCDLSKIDPGGGASSPTAVSLRGTPDAGGGGTAGESVAAVDVVSGDPGTIAGRVSLEGSAAALAPLVAKGTSKVDPAICAKDGAIPDQSLVLSESGGVANVFIYLSKTPKGMEFANPENLDVLDQKLCIFKPHGVVWRSGFDITLKNSDAVAHNIQMLCQKNPQTNDAMPGGTEAVKSFKKSEPAPFEAKCAYHPWMRFYALVVDHPFAAVTDENGNFSIPPLPPGKHAFRVWHERGGMLESKLVVDVKPGAETTVELKYEPAKFEL